MEERFRVKLDASAGMIEVEGPESFVREMLDRYESVMDSSAGKTRRRKARHKAGEKVGAAKQTAELPRPKKARSRGAQPDEELMDTLEEHRAALAAYLDERKVASQKDEAAIIASFLASKVGLPSMNDSQYVTVLRALKRRLPKNPRQVLLDAKNKKQFFDEEDSSFTLTTTGLNFVEHDSLKGGASD